MSPVYSFTVKTTGISNLAPLKIEAYSYCYANRKVVPSKDAKYKPSLEKVGPMLRTKVNQSPMLRTKVNQSPMLRTKVNQRSSPFRLLVVCIDLQLQKPYIT